MIKEKQCGVQFDGSKLSKKEAELEVKQELVSRILNKRAILAMSKGQVGAGVKKESNSVLVSFTGGVVERGSCLTRPAVRVRAGADERANEFRPAVDRRDV